jgi:hypothetical protein
MILLNILWIPLKSQTNSADSSKSTTFNADSLKIKIKEGVSEAVSITKDAVNVTKDALSTKIDSSRIVVSQGFISHLDAVDTLTFWIFQKKFRKPNFGFLSQTYP